MCIANYNEEQIVEVTKIKENIIEYNLPDLKIEENNIQYDLNMDKS